MSKAEQLINAPPGSTARTTFDRATEHFAQKEPPKLSPIFLAKVVVLQLKRERLKRNGHNISISKFESELKFNTRSVYNKKRGRPRGSFKHIPALSVTALMTSLPENLISQLRPLHIRLLDLYLTGMKIIDVAAECGITMATVQNVKNSPLGHAYLESRKREKLEEVQQLVEPAVDTLRTTMDRDDRDFDIKVAQKTALSLLKSEGGLR